MHPQLPALSLSLPLSLFTSSSPLLSVTSAVVFACSLLSLLLFSVIYCNNCSILSSFVFSPLKAPLPSYILILQESTDLASHLEEEEDEVTE